MALGKDSTKRLLQELVDEFSGFIEDISIDQGNIIISGWSVDFISKSKPKDLLVFINDEVQVSRYKSIMRKDIIDAHFDLDESEYGFEIILKYESEINLVKVFSLNENETLCELSPLNGGSALQVELIGKCNLRCPACPSVSHTGFHGQELNEDEIDMLKPMMLDANSMCFDGFGEVTLSDKLEYALATVPLTQNLVFHTNGMLLDQYRELLISHGIPLRHIIVSIDSLDDKRYNQLRVGGNLSKVLQNIRDFVAYRNSLDLKYPKVIPNMMILSSNFLEMRNFIDLASGLDGIVEFIHLFQAEKLDSVKKRSFIYKDEKLSNSFEDFNKEFLFIQEYAKQQDVKISMNGSILEVNKSESNNAYFGKEIELCECPYINSSACIQADGKFMFCVWQTQAIFNWREENTMDFHLSDRANSVRSMIKNNIIPYECSGSGCPYVGRKKSEEENPNPQFNFKGGWQS